MTDVDGGASETPTDETEASTPSRNDDAPADPSRTETSSVEGKDSAEGPFTIPRHPTRRYPRNGGVEYDGDTVFVLTPKPAQETEALREAVEGVLESDEYTYGDWFNLPMPLYLVHDEVTGDVFRVSIRDGRVRFHVLPATESAGLSALYERLQRQTDVAWSVECRTDG